MQPMQLAQRRVGLVQAQLRPVAGQVGRGAVDAAGTAEAAVVAELVLVGVVAELGVDVESRRSGPRRGGR